MLPDLNSPTVLVLDLPNVVKILSLYEKTREAHSKNPSDARLEQRLALAGRWLDTVLEKYDQLSEETRLLVDLFVTNWYPKGMFFISKERSDGSLSPGGTKAWRNPRIPEYVVSFAVGVESTWSRLLSFSAPHLLLFVRIPYYHLSLTRSNLVFLIVVLNHDIVPINPSRPYTRPVAARTNFPPPASDRLGAITDGRRP